MFYNSGGSGKSLWDAARDIVASREQGKFIQYICFHYIFLLLAETLPTESNTVLFVGSRNGVK